MKLSEVLIQDNIEIGITIDSKEELLSTMVDIIFHSSDINNKKEALKDVMIRENLMSTGVGKGIALPHAKTKAVDKPIAGLVILNNKIDYDSLDNEPINIAFMLLSPESDLSFHLKLLSRISRLLNNDSFRLKLLNAKTKKEIIKLFVSMEEI